MKLPRPSFSEFWKLRKVRFVVGVGFVVIALSTAGSGGSVWLALLLMFLGTHYTVDAIYAYLLHCVKRHTNILAELLKQKHG